MTVKNQMAVGTDRLRMRHCRIGAQGQDCRRSKKL
jgi:hypothetical protein